MVKSVIKPIKVYKVEVGVLLQENNKEFNDYACVYDKKHAYYNEITFFFTNKRKAIAWAKKYVHRGVARTYAVVSALNYDPVAIYGSANSLMYSFEDMKQIEEEVYLENYVDLFGEDNWDVKNVIFNIYKPKECSLATNIF